MKRRILGDWPGEDVRCIPGIECLRDSLSIQRRPGIEMFEWVGAIEVVETVRAIDEGNAAPPRRLRRAS